MTTRIVEQARQKPPNSTPYGFDKEDIIYPKVNTCLSVTAVGETYLFGLHLGMLMNCGEDPTDNFTVYRSMLPAISDIHLKMYLNVLKTKSKLNNLINENNKIERIYVAGSIGTWTSNLPERYNQIKEFVKSWGKKENAKVQFWKFDDTRKENQTVDIYIRRYGLYFLSSSTKKFVRAIKVPV